MSADKKASDDGIIELTDVMEEEDQFDDQDMDQEFEIFLNEDDQETTTSSDPERHRDKSEAEPNFDALFDQDKSDEDFNEDWVVDNDDDEHDFGFQNLDAFETQEDSEETNELETLLADLDNQTQAAAELNFSENQSAETRQEFETMTQDIQELQQKIDAFPSAKALHTLLEKEGEAEASALSPETEEDILHKASERLNEALEEKIQTLEQKVQEQMQEMEQKIKSTISEELKHKLNSYQQKTEQDIQEVLSQMSEQNRDAQSAMHQLKETMHSQKAELESLHTELRTELEEKIQQFVPQAAAKVIRDEIQKMVQEG